VMVIGRSKSVPLQFHRHLLLAMMPPLGVQRMKVQATFA
jgi:hypothetical protein